MDADRRLPRDRRVGQHVGDYVLEDPIGRGGMGVVFRARHAVTERIVAVKLMAAELADTPSFRERFVREAEAGPHLDHPRIVSVLESGDAHGELFIAMELVEGADLKRLIRQEGRLDPKRVLSIFRQAASGLDAAHEAGMVHRDIKPENILVVPRESPQATDRVYLTDFGLVRPVTSETPSSHSGQVFGSVAYMAPELIQGFPADGRADVYAMGCVLYECLTGKAPFERDNEVSTVWAHIHEDPPLLTDACRDLPAGMNDVVSKAMAKDPDDRFLTAGELVTELELAVGGKLATLTHTCVRPLVARIPRRKRERDVWSPNFFPELSRVRTASRERLDGRKAVALGAAILAFVAFVSVEIDREEEAPQATQGPAEVVGSARERVIETGLGNADKGHDKSREGHVGARSYGGGEKVLRGAGSSIGDGGGGQTRLFRQPQAVDDEEPFASGDETRNGKIAFHRYQSCNSAGVGCDRNVYTVRRDGSGPVDLTPGELQGTGPSWSPDGRKILFTGWTVGHSDIWIVSGDGTGLRNVTQTVDISEGSGSWSPDGKRIAFSRTSEGVGIWVMNADGTDRRQVTSTEAWDRVPEWSPDGGKIVFERRERCGTLVTGQECSPAAEIYVVNVDGSGLARLGAGGSPHWAPDASKIAFYRSTESFSTSDIFVMNADGSGVVNVTKSSSLEISPAWAPDGRHLIFKYENVLASISLGTGTIRQRTDIKSCDSPSWQPRIGTSPGTRSHR